LRAQEDEIAAKTDTDRQKAAQWWMTSNWQSGFLSGSAS